MPALKPEEKAFLSSWREYTYEEPSDFEAIIIRFYPDYTKILLDFGLKRTRARSILLKYVRFEDRTTLEKGENSQYVIKEDDTCFEKGESFSLFRRVNHYYYYNKKVMEMLAQDL